MRGMHAVERERAELRMDEERGSGAGWMENISTSIYTIIIDIGSVTGDGIWKEACLVWWSACSDVPDLTHCHHPWSPAVEAERRRGREAEPERQSQRPTVCLHAWLSTRGS